MWKRIKDAILPKRKETAERERCLKERAERVQTWLYPVFHNWELTCDILMWKTPLLSTTIFFLISGTFWAFLPPNYQLCITILGIGLFILALHREIRTYAWNIIGEGLELQIKEKNKMNAKPEEISLTIASIYTNLSDHVVFLRELRHSASSRFYCLMAVYVFAVLATWTFVPIIRLTYILCCSGFFYPSIRYYGMIDKLKAKLAKLTEPVATHWEYNLTKRQRKLIVESQYDTESDDEFALERTKYTTQVLSAVVGKGISGSQTDLTSSTNDSLAGFDIPSPTSLYHADDFTDDEEFRPSEFERGLEMPSLSQFDSLMEPYDEFHFGLNFPDADQSLTQGVSPSLQSMPEYSDLTDDEVEELPLEENTDGNAVSRRPTTSDGVRQRHLRPPNRGDKTRTGAQHVRSVDNSMAPQRDSPRGMERDYEFLDHSELDDASGMPTQHGQQHDRNGKYLGKVVSYSQASLSHVSKWLGY